ncbi:MAG TPA: hypothetical protein VHK88_20235 [Aquihabitans sp.]|jgi:hypothetical protein|nr:hypothetical protein [Aquihabitans sp.]
MPLTPDEEAIADRLTDLHRATQESLLAQIASASTSPNAKSHLRALLAEVDRLFTQLLEGARAWVSDALPGLYRAGATAAANAAGNAFAWTQVHREAVEALARRTWDDVATTLQQVSADTKRVIRSLLDDTVRRQVVEGVPGPRASGQLARALQSETGAATVTYSNGARHAMADYADTVARTTTATTRNAGAINQARADGITYVEVFDGSDCGWASHNTPPLANGLVVTLEEAESQPLSHPRCARSFGPRPDVRTPQEAEEGRRYSPAEQQRMAAEERARAATQNVDGRRRGTFAAPTAPTGRQPRASRSSRATRTPRSPVSG